MNEWFKNFRTKTGALWGKWTALQKGIFAGIVLTAIVLIFVLSAWSSRSTAVPVIDMKITDQVMLDKIVLRLNEEDVRTTVSSDGVVYVSDEQTARRMRSILIREDLIPKEADPWAIFDVERWTRMDFDRKIDVRRAVIDEVRKHIKALDDIDDVSVVVNLPEKAMFGSEQNPVSASIIVYPKPGSDVSQNRKKVEGIQKILKLAVEGLADENITIADNKGTLLNDFDGAKDWDRLTLIERQQKFIARQEIQYEAKILNALQKIYGMDRVRDLNIKIDMDMSEKSSNTTKIIPTEIRPDNPETPFDDSEVVISVTAASKSATTGWEGSGTNPEGPEGVEGQTAPSYKDTSIMAGRSTQSIVERNEIVSSSQIQEVESPQMGRRTVSVNIDGIWSKKINENGFFVIKNGRIEREYTPIPPEEIRQIEKIVKDSIGFDALRKDSVTVTNVRFDRTKEFEQEDFSYFRNLQRQKIILYSLAGIALALAIFIIYRVVSRELERRRRLKEEEELRRAQLERERILWEAERANQDVAMTVDERRRLELQENAINIAREHPEDVALLIRTWLMEE